MPDQSALLQDLQARALAMAAQAAGLTAAAAAGALPFLQGMPAMEPPEDSRDATCPVATAQRVAEEMDDMGGDLLSAGEQSDQSFTCSVCRKMFKREMNLIFHMTTHRPRQPQAEATEPSSTQPVKCQDCNKEFATKYQAKKHYLRRHFQGDKPFACTKCNKKRFVVKEDLTMHMKSCGNVYVCNCGIRLCSLGALKRHCKYFSHEPESLDPKPEDPQATDALNAPMDWSTVSRSNAFHDGSEDAVAAPSADPAYQSLLNAELQQRMSSRVGSMPPMHGMGAMGVLSNVMGNEDPMNVCSQAVMMRQMASQSSADHVSWPRSNNEVGNLFPGMPLSLVHALRQAQAGDSSYGQNGMQLGGYAASGSAGGQHHPAALNAAVSAAYAQTSGTGNGYNAPAVELGYQHEQP